MQIVPTLRQPINRITSTSQYAGCDRLGDYRELDEKVRPVPGMNRPLVKSGYFGDGRGAGSTKLDTL